MAIRRTKRQKSTAQVRLSKNRASGTKKTGKSAETSSLTHSNDQINLIKKDLLKTLFISATIFILLFGIYIYLR